MNNVKKMILFGEERKKAKFEKAMAEVEKYNSEPHASEEDLQKEIEELKNKHMNEFNKEINKWKYIFPSSAIKTSFSYISFEHFCGNKEITRDENLFFKIKNWPLNEEYTLYLLGISKNYDNSNTEIGKRQFAQIFVPLWKSVWKGQFVNNKDKNDCLEIKEDLFGHIYMYLCIMQNKKSNKYLKEMNAILNEITNNIVNNIVKLNENQKKTLIENTMNIVS